MAPTGQWGALFRVRLISAEGGEVCSVSGLKTLKSRRKDAEYAEVDEEGQGSGRFRRSKRFDCRSFRVIFSVFSCCQAVFLWPPFHHRRRCAFLFVVVVVKCDLASVFFLSLQGSGKEKSASKSGAGKDTKDGAENPPNDVIPCFATLHLPTTWPTILYIVYNKLL